MDLDDLSKLNQRFSDEYAEMNKEFNELFNKWLKKSPRLCCIMSIHLPINIIMSMIHEDKNNDIPKICPELPHMFERFLAPFIKIKKHWGVISCAEFSELYSKEYKAQFDEFIPDEENRKKFKEWFDKDLKKHKENKKGKK
jgi:hypothetical protein